MTQSDAPGQLGDQAVVGTIVERGMENINLCVCLCVWGGVGGLDTVWIGKGVEEVSYNKSRKG